jgi:cell division protease FtsH
LPRLALFSISALVYLDVDIYGSSVGMIVGLRPRLPEGRKGGQQGQRVGLKEIQGGFENDIEQATNLARAMVTRWGMSEKLGTVQLAPRENPFLGGGYPGEKPFSEETARAIDEEVLRIIDESHEEARRLLTKHRGDLEALARALLERETLDEEEILRVTGLPPAPPLENTGSRFRTSSPAETVGRRAH